MLEPGLPSSHQRPYVKGKFLYVNNEKFFLKGVTYGTFEPDGSGSQFPPADRVEKDFRMMADNGFNCVRTYTVPPLYLLEIALQHQLKVMIGLPWEQHITFLDTNKQVKDIIRRVREGALLCKEHPAILCFAVGNEIPAPIVRWYGKNKIESFIRKLYNAVKEVDPVSLVTYVNFPTTEYLDLSFLDFDCFNVYLETPQKLGAYIARLHNLAGDRPLVLAEIGLDSMRNGEQRQAETLTWQIKTIFARGCAGMFVFAWTDEWWRGGFEIEDWDFGIVDRQRRPKKALYAVRETMNSIPFAGNEGLPFISVIVCSYNGSATIRDCMEGLQRLNYPHYEVIVIDDGSTDQVAAIVKEYPVKLISTPNRGLSNARNTGFHQAKGEIVAYIDDDAYPDPHWLQYLAYAYLSSSHAAIGGPNIVPAEDGPIAKCVANAPGGPVHVLLDDEIAEHIPGCNMSFRKAALAEIGGFDPVYRAAGDDVDICWRLQNAGKTVGFHPSALVWHHRRNSIKAYWKQQKGYGKAEALLEAKWPERYNGFGHIAWTGRIYGNGFTLPINLKKGKVFYGTWGTALFQSVYQPTHGVLNAIPLMPEWYLFSGLLAALAFLGFFWPPLYWCWLLFLLSVLIIFIQAAISAHKNISLLPEHTNLKYKSLIAFLHVIQPMARLYGRLRHGLTPWTKIYMVYDHRFAFVISPKTFTHWSEKWRSSEDWLTDIEKSLINFKTRVKRGGNYDRWDIQTRNSLFSISRGLLTIEEHGSNKQLLRFKIWPGMSKTGMVVIGGLSFIVLITALNLSLIGCFIIGSVLLVLVAEYFKDSAGTMYNLFAAFKGLEREEPDRSKTIALTQETTQDPDGKNYQVLREN